MSHGNADITVGSKVVLTKNIAENLDALHDQGCDFGYAILNASGILTVESIEGDNFVIEKFKHLGVFHRDAFVLA